MGQQVDKDGALIRATVVGVVGEAELMLMRGHMEDDDGVARSGRGMTISTPFERTCHPTCERNISYIG